MNNVIVGVLALVMALVIFLDLANPLIYIAGTIIILGLAAANYFRQPEQG